MKFLALDFETADYGRDSACALGLVRVENNAILRRKHLLIRPPRRDFHFTYIHGIYWDDVKNQPTFGESWPEIEEMMTGVDFLVAHNASFDKGVLSECCRKAGLPVPELEFRCTMKLARQIWRIYPTNLPAVCSHFNIPLKHHDAASDTEACAKIMIEALKHS